MIRSLHVNPIKLVSRTESLEFLGLFREHDMLVWLLELPYYFRGYKVYFLT